MSENLYAASHQWSTRPDDQRFATLAELYDATRRYRESARTAAVPYRNLLCRQSINGDGADLELVGPQGIPAKLTHWAFGQLARNVGAPADYLRRLDILTRSRFGTAAEIRADIRAALDFGILEGPSGPRW